MHYFLVMKMMAVLSALHFLTLCGTEISARPGTVIDAVAGQEVQFPVDNQCEDRYEVTFRLLSSVVAVLASRGTDGSERRHPVYEDRLYWSATDSPVLSNVRVTDSKRYGIQLSCYDPNATDPNEEIFDLRVFEPVSKPVIKKTGNCSSPNITLSCSASSGTNVTICWEILSLSGDSRTFDGPELVINHVNEWQQYTLRCTAKNRVSNASSEQNKTDRCNRNNFPRTGQKLLWFSTAPILLLTLILIIFICYKVKQGATNKGRNRARQRPEEKIFCLPDELIEPTYVTTLDSH
ncbi:T-lymphocyte surface antigen Ly-9-like isoform X1 [Pristis pectinata]|uniref:T-lymphocyte surface antigen Ly-9-like isoform X1 n=1 Tax=Pristis pectinata TaxID=685728 RepID=UPI00223DC490|nr:T-lymphocyte surface antigen Ly-9-like isoform X1 [Pristis pectinata]XP_051873747.1 T-lymphocyte surface antigen Ly-9-like isoform X1 [Pristis pectinata]